MPIVTFTAWNSCLLYTSIQRKKYQEVAEELNISVSAVRKHIVKALQVIREECAKKS